MEIWSVVHLPFALISSFKPFRSVPSQSSEGGEAARGAENFGLHHDLHAFAIFGGGLVAGVVYGKTFRRQFYAGGFVEHYFFALFIFKFILEGVEGQVAGNGEGRDDLGGGDKSVRACQAVIAFGENSY